MLVEQLGNFALTLDEFRHLVVAHRLGELEVYLLVLLEQVHGFLHCLLHHLFYGFVIVELGFLFQISHRVARGKHHFALIALVHPCYYLEQGRFSGSVQTDDAYLGTVEKGEIDVFKHLFLRRVQLAHTYHREDYFFVVGHNFLFLVGNAKIRFFWELGGRI